MEASAEACDYNPSEAPVAALFTQSVWRPHAGDGDEHGPGPGAVYSGDGAAGDG